MQATHLKQEFQDTYHEPGGSNDASFSRNSFVFKNTVTQVVKVFN